MLYTHNQTYLIAIDFLSGGIWEIFLQSMNMYCLYVSKSEKKKVAWVCIQKPSYTKALLGAYISPFN